MNPKTPQKGGNHDVAGIAQSHGLKKVETRDWHPKASENRSKPISLFVPRHHREVNENAHGRPCATTEPMSSAQWDESMELIQKACDQLAGHWDCDVSRLALEIASADRSREAEHQNDQIKMEASISNISAKLNVAVATIRRLEAKNKKYSGMLFGPSSERTDRNSGNWGQGRM